MVEVCLLTINITAVTLLIKQRHHISEVTDVFRLVADD